MISDRLSFSNIESSLLAHISYGRVIKCIVHTEQGENYGTMILDGVCHSSIHFGRVILSRMVDPYCSQSPEAFLWSFMRRGPWVVLTSPVFSPSLWRGCINRDILDIPYDLRTRVRLYFLFTPYHLHTPRSLRPLFRSSPFHTSQSLQNIRAELFSLPITYEPPAPQAGTTIILCYPWTYFSS